MEVYLFIYGLHFHDIIILWESTKRANFVDKVLFGDLDRLCSVSGLKTMTTILEIKLGKSLEIPEMFGIFWHVFLTRNARKSITDSTALKSFFQRSIFLLWKIGFLSHNFGSSYA